MNRETSSRYFRSTSLLDATSSFWASSNCRVSRLPAEEANELSDEIRRRNVFARHSWENNFYVKRMKSLGDETVIEVFLPGQPSQISGRADLVASTIEKIAVLSSQFGKSRDEMKRALGVSGGSTTEINFIIGPNVQYISSRQSKANNEIKGVEVNRRFCRRFERCSLGDVFELCVSSHSLSKRVSSTIDWLFQSISDPLDSASLVKCSIAFETLLILNKSEPLARSLSERTAFLLSSDPSVRKRISRLVKSFYDVRSAIVHGIAKKPKAVETKLLTSMQRIAILVCIVLAGNTGRWKNTEALRLWFEDQRWGTPWEDIKTPFPHTYLLRALEMGEKASS